MTRAPDDFAGITKEKRNPLKADDFAGPTRGGNIRNESEVGPTLHWKGSTRAPKDEHFHHELMEAQPGIREGLMADEGLEIRLSDPQGRHLSRMGKSRPIQSLP